MVWFGFILIPWTQRVMWEWQYQFCAWESKLEDGWKLVTEGVKSSILKNEAVMESIQQSVTTSVVPSASSVAQVLEAVESKLKSYAEVDHAIRVGKEDKGPRPILIRFATVDARNNALSHRSKLRGKSLWLDPDLTPLQGAPIYQRLGSGEDPLSALTEAVIAVHELGPVWVVGDFNSHVGDAQSLELNEEGVAVWRNFNADESWCRSAEDEGRNGMSEFFMQFAAAGGLTIINGTAPFPDTQSVTCRTHNGSSTMDFLLACKSAQDRILDFSFGPFSPELDHRPLRCTLMGFEREIRRQYRRSKVGVCLDVTKRHQYETTLMNKLHGRELTSGTLANIITGVAKEVFTAKQPRDKGWFDEDCRVARSKAMSAVDQRTAFRQYNNFIRARKRRFICQHQRVLVGELMKCPKTFWQRFCSRIILPELKAEDLYN
ncbi:hypothetical protein R1sor_014115 [Riccia sorocarpa]|uniref:Endonuclease/exonuclease/phosphatase domain-containing protein n=1 Tax=Riccia sorocarpa TaxID=122646 RepID=A0ABD3HCM9_9MARC